MDFLLKSLSDLRWFRDRKRSKVMFWGLTGSTVRVFDEKSKMTDFESDPPKIVFLSGDKLGWDFRKTDWKNHVFFTFLTNSEKTTGFIFRLDYDEVKKHVVETLQTRFFWSLVNWLRKKLKPKKREKRSIFDDFVMYSSQNFQTVFRGL